MLVPLTLNVILMYNVSDAYLFQPDELKYTLKRLVDGLGHTREVARPGFSLALGQVGNTCLLGYTV